MPEALAKSEKKNLVMGEKFVEGRRAVHIHKCGHECNSSYCEDPPLIDCDNCGGPPRIQAGYEPWRGR